MTILLTAIFKDDSEYEIAKRMLESFMPHVNGLAVALTGTSGQFDKLKKLIKSYNGKYVITTPQTHPKIYLQDGDKYIFANFSEARNVSFQLADSMPGYDWYIWADVDDILIGGEQLHAVAEQATLNKYDAVFFTYWYSIRRKEDGSFDENDVEIEHIRERLIKPKTFKWVSRLHEVAVPLIDGYQPRLSNYDWKPQEGRSCVWAHITDKDRVDGNLNRNITILEAQIKEEEHKDPRTIFYLAKTYYDLHTSQHDDLALFLLKDYLELSGWAEERANAWQYIGNIYVRKGDHRKALEAFHKAVEEYPINHMHYLYLAREYAELQLFDQSDFWLNMVLHMDAPQARTTIGNPLEIKYMAASLKYNECMRKGKYQEALTWLQTRNNLGQHKQDGMEKTLKDIIDLNETCKWVFQYAKWLKDHGHEDKVNALLQSLPSEIGREPFVYMIANSISKPKVWDEKSIVYYASWGVEHFEGWSAKSLQKGIGGSETAVIELAKRWVKMGYKVTVFGDPRENTGTYEGVEYRPWYEINWNDTFNVLILWRSPHLLDRDIKARRIYMDLHDVANQLDWSEPRMQKIDKVFFKSLFHRRMIPKLPDDKAVVISNGIST